MSNVWERITLNRPLRCPRCHKENYPSKVHRGLRYKGSMITAMDYKCSHCGNEYNNGPGYPSAFTGLTPNEYVSHLEKQLNITINHQDKEQKCNSGFHNTKRKKEVGVPSVGVASQCGTRAGADYINDPVRMRRFAEAKISQEYWDRKDKEYQKKRNGCLIVLLIIAILVLVFNFG